MSMVIYGEPDEAQNRRWTLCKAVNAFGHDVSAAHVFYDYDHDTA
jgi:hypothetical protein